MADAVVALFGIALFCIALYVAVRLYVGWRRRANQWQISERTTGLGDFQIILTRGGERIRIQAEDTDDKPLTYVSCYDQDWDQKVALLRDEAKYKLRTLNGR